MTIAEWTPSGVELNVMATTGAVCKKSLVFQSRDSIGGVFRQIERVHKEFDMF